MISYEEDETKKRLKTIDLVHDIFCGEVRNITLEKEIYGEKMGRKGKR